MTPPKPFREFDSHRFSTNTKTPSLIYLYNPDAKIRQLIEPVVSKLCQRHLNGVDCFALDVDKNKDFTFELKVTRAPSFVLFHRGKEIRRLTNITYDEGFESRFDVFLTGDFLFDDSSFNRLEKVNFFSGLKDWHQYNVVAFMQTTDPINWQLEETLRDIYENNVNFLRLHLVNSDKNESLLNHFKIRNLPAVNLFKQSDEVKRWHPASNPEKIRRECQDVISPEDENPD